MIRFEAVSRTLESTDVPLWASATGSVMGWSIVGEAIQDTLYDKYMDNAIGMGRLAVGLVVAIPSTILAVHRLKHPSNQSADSIDLLAQQSNPPSITPKSEAV